MTEPPHTRARQVGPYRLLSRIGEGGMGVVYLAQKNDGPRVALKQLRSHVVGDDEGRARLAREVTSLRRVRSPRVAEVIDDDPWLGGLVAVVVAACGPFARRPREIVRRWTLEISRRRTGWVQVGAALGCAAATSVAVLAYGTIWAPIDHPPRRADLPLVDKTVWFPVVDGQG